MTATAIGERRLAALKTVRNFLVDRRPALARPRLRQRTQKRFRPTRPYSDDRSKPSAQSGKQKRDK
jgi:hypothetical protein